MKNQVAVNGLWAAQWLRGGALVFGCVTSCAMCAQVLPSGVQPVYAQTLSAQSIPAQPMLRISALPVAAAQTDTDSSDPKVKDDLFAGTQIFEKGASDVTEISMDPDTLNLVGGRDAKGAHNMLLNVVRTYEYDKPGMYRMQDVDTFRNKLDTGDWHCSVHVRELKTGESTDVCTKHRTDNLVETAIITVEPKELTFIHTISRAHSGSGDLGGVPLALGLGSLPSLALLDPEAFAEMHMALHGLGNLNTSALQTKLHAEMQSRAALQEAQKQLQRLNGSEMQQKLKELQGPDMQRQLQELQAPAMQRQLDQVNKELKELQQTRP